MTLTATTGVKWKMMNRHQNNKAVYWFINYDRQMIMPTFMPISDMIGVNVTSYNPQVWWLDVFLVISIWTNGLWYLKQLLFDIVSFAFMMVTSYFWYLQLYKYSLTKNILKYLLIVGIIYIWWKWIFEQNLEG